MFTALALALVPAAAAAPLDFWCAAPLRHYGQVRQILAGPDYRVSGELWPGRLEAIPDPSLPVLIVGNDIPTYLRFADVTIESEIDPGRYVSLTVMPRYQGGNAENVADVYVQFRGNDDAEEDVRPLGTISTRGQQWERLPFTIEAHPGRVTIEAGGQRTEIAVVLGSGASLNLACIGGDFRFGRMAWGDLTAPAAPAGRR
jgi:hypothetical protein